MSHSTFVINLKSRPDRLANFFMNSIPFLEVVEAIQDTSHPNYGCTQSHKKALELSRFRGDSHCFIFEDDATLNVPFNTIYDCVRDLEKQRDWEIILFSCSQGFASTEHTILGSGIELLRIDGIFNGTFAMAISCRAYDKLINRLNIARSTDDVDINIYSKECAGNIYLVLPFMCYVLSDQSDIRKYDTSGDLEQIKLCESRLFINTSFMSGLLH